MIKWLESAGMQIALESMRLPYNSQGDSVLYIGQRDMKLAVQLIKRGGSHRKFLRMWQFWFEAEATVKFWFQFDTYKVGVTSMSESTMHRLRQNDWKGINPDVEMKIKALKQAVDIGRLSDIEAMYELPMGMMYRRIVNLNAEVFLRMYWDRKNHRLPEWKTFLQEFREKDIYIDQIIKELER